MGAIYKECVGCNLRYASIDEDLCDSCFSDFQGMKEAKGGGKGRVPMPPPTKVMQDSRTQRSRTRGDAERSALHEDVCLTCGGTGRSRDGKGRCSANCDDGYATE